MKCFLLTFNIASVAQDALLELFNGRREIRNWYTPFPGTILLVTLGAQDNLSLTNIIREAFPGATFVIAPVDAVGAQGWMPNVFWKLLQNPVSSGKWDNAPDTMASLAGLLLNAGKKRP